MLARAWLGLLALGLNSLLGAILVVVWGVTKWSTVKTAPITGNVTEAR